MMKFDTFFLHFLHFQSHLRYVLRVEVQGKLLYHKKLYFWLSIYLQCGGGQISSFMETPYVLQLGCKKAH